jgi:molecular chaperone HtpG
MTPDREARAPAPTMILHIKPDTDTEKYDTFAGRVRASSPSSRNTATMCAIPSRCTAKRAVEKEKPEPDAKPADYKPEYESYTELETLNSMVPIWKKQKSEVKDEEYNELLQGAASTIIR